LCCANPLGWVWKAGRGQKGPARNLVSATTSAMETRPGTMERAFRPADLTRIIQ
jgi:hypothetical protein